jgi:D-sedoheptulose 7-phosphate isomerase
MLLSGSTNYSSSSHGKNLEHIQEYISGIKSVLDDSPVEALDQVIDVLHEARISGQQIFIMGNGGSAATASHFVCDLAKNTRKPGWPSFRVIGLSDNMPIFSAYGNDEGYENVFREQLANLVQKNDIVLGISGSGNSSNVVKAIELANQMGAFTIAFTGFSGGKLGPLAEIHVNIPCDNMQKVEDVHMAWVHLISSRLGKLAEPLDFVQSEKTDARKDKPRHQKVIIKPEQVGTQVPSEIALMKQLSGISKEFAESLNLHEMLTRILLLTTNVVGAESGSIMVLDESGERVVDGAVVYSGNVQTRSVEKLSEIVDRGLAGWVVENRQSALINDTHEDDRWLARTYEVENRQSRSAVSVPLMSHERVVGVVTLVRPRPENFSLQDLALLTAITVTLSYSISIPANQS